MYLFDLINKYKSIQERETLLGVELGKLELAQDIFKKLQEVEKKN